MPTNAILVVSIPDKVPKASIQALRTRIRVDLGLTDQDFYPDGPLIPLPNADDELAHPVDPSGILYDVNVLRAYYGVGYERGDLPLLIRIAEWLEVRLPGCQVLYGHDSDGETYPFDAAARAKLRRYYENVGHRPYADRGISPAEKDALRARYDK